jgi:hypothetical protein
MESHILHYRNTVLEQSNIWKMKHISVKTRPSMRAVLATKQSVRGSTTGSVMDDDEGSGLEMVTFGSFCDNVRFPNCMSPLLRIRCYLLAAQSHLFDFRQYTKRFVSDDIATVSSVSLAFSFSSISRLFLNC